MTVAQRIDTLRNAGFSHNRIAAILGCTPTEVATHTGGGAAPVLDQAPLPASQVLGNKTGAVTIDAANKYQTDVTATLTGNVTLTVNNLPNGGKINLKITQDGTGSRTLTLPGGTKVPGGSLGISTTAAAVDLVTLYRDAGGVLLATLTGKAFA